LGTRGLGKWDSVSWDRGGDGGTGCLGREVELIMKNRVRLPLVYRDQLRELQVPPGTRSTLGIAALDSVLDELAAPSLFSQLSQPPTRPRAQITILKLLYRKSHLSPYALSVLTQIILRDLRPLLSPLPHLPIRNPTAMLLLRSTAGPSQLGLYEAMRCWDRKMAEMYVGGKGSLDWCADMAEGDRTQTIIPAGPVIGVNVQV